MEAIKEKGLTANQLKLIAIVAMTIDHIAWGFVDMFSVLGQTMHVIGRLTIPIMCFFIVEGYKKTSNLRAYIYRMATFAVITIIPFYLFFGEEYGYRQNIIFDYLLALLGLSIVASEKLCKWKKVCLFALVATVSAVIGGWPVFPMILVLIFYYVKSKKKQFVLIFGSVILVELAVIAVVYINNNYHLFRYEWTWYEFMYFFGFVLALPLLSLYNGEKGKYPLGRYFFFEYYPFHFCILFTIKSILAGNIYDIYLDLHVICLLCIIIFAVLLIKQTPSQASITCTMLCFSGAIYTFGFIMEILTDDLSFAFAGVVIEYLGECILFLCYLRFICVFCNRNIPKLVYGIAAILSGIIMFCVATTRETGIFYSSMHMDYSGPFHRLVLDYSWGYYIFLFYMLALFALTIFICIQSMVRSTGIERKRIANVMMAILAPWIAFLIWVVGLTGGYEVAVLGVLGAVFLIYRAIVQYGYFNSIQLAEENALYHLKEGIMVADGHNRITYINEPFRALFDVKKDEIVDNPVLLNMISGKLIKYAANDRIYDVESIPLVEKGYTQGYMINLHDMTDHYMRLDMAEHYANTDGLTGLSNRKFFIKSFISFRKCGGTGTMLMFDLDNFKGVNDNLGHDTGDAVLMTLTETLLAADQKRHLTCRIGGDEFVMFLKNVTDKTEVSDICEQLIKDFANRLSNKNLANVTSISVGANRIEETNVNADEQDFLTNYKLSDGALYLAKTSGKATYRLA